MPEKGPTKAQRRAANRQLKAASREEEKNKLSRRNFLIRLGLGGVGFGVAGISLPTLLKMYDTLNYQSTPLPPVDPSKYEVNPIQLTASLPPRPGIRSYPSISNSDIEEMWNEAKSSTPFDPLRKIASMPQHVSAIFTELTSKKTSRGTGLMIDQSGLFLTARHVITEDLKTPAMGGIVYHPGFNQSFRVTQMIYSPDGDLGLIYAPTGLARGRVNGVQIATEEIGQDMQLRQYGTLVNQGSVWLAQMDGTALSPDFKPYPRYSFKGLRSVYGMIPFGGSSGGPIVSLDSGSVMAVESGLIATKGTLNIDRNNYIGSTVAPVTDMDHIIRTQQIHKL